MNHCYSKRMIPKPNGTARGNRRCTLSHEKALLMIYSALMRHLIIHLLLQIVAVERALNALAWFYILKGV